MVVEDICEYHRQYYEHFGVRFTDTPKGVKVKNRKRVKRALEHALDTRKFEIELYWKRTSYFWTLISVALVGYIAVLQIEKSGFANDRYAFIVACMGIVLSFAWYLANKGSKYWQENWENHVSLLEDIVIGPLFKLTSRRPKLCEYELLGISEDEYPVEIFVTRPERFSVSKVNIIVSVFTILIWCVLLFIASSFGKGISPDYIKILVAFITFTACGSMYVFFARSHKGGHLPIISKQNVSCRILD